MDPFLNYKVSDAVYQRFSFDAFQMEDAEVMYLHCEVLVCAKNLVNSTRCAEGCVENSGGSRRKRRDETNQEQKGVTSLGPLKILLDRLEVQGPDQGMYNVLHNKTKTFSLSLGTSDQFMSTSRLRELPEPAVFVPEVAKQHDELLSVYS